MKFAIISLAAVFAADAALACGGHQEASQTTVIASNTDKSAPAQKSDAPVAPAPAKADAAKAEAFKLIDVAAVDAGLTALNKDKKPDAIFDANSKATREAQGIIPTAVLLSSSSEYDVKLLPQNKETPVVFYCANTKCTASHTAAKRAAEAGHKDVNVLAPGIKGWVEAGKAVDKPVG